MNHANGKSPKKIEWAPLHIPFARRIQTLVVAFFLALQLVLIIVSLSLLFSVVYTIPMILYMTWMYFDKAPSNGKGRRFEWARQLSVFNYMRDYFPVNLIKTADLDPTKTYIFGYHPHGILSVGAFVNFCTEATGWSQKFPGIKASLLTLGVQFMCPFWRDFLLALGASAVNAPSCINHLKQGPGSAIVIVIGGAQESLASKPGFADLTIKNRKGFVKIALTQGASLVPVFSFGENDIWDQVDNSEGSIVRKFQDKMKQYITFMLPLIQGRGFFQYNFGLLPFRRPIHTVIGKPIDLPLIPQPSAEEIEKYHELYLNGLKELYDAFKDIYHKDRQSDMKFL